MRRAGPLGRPPAQQAGTAGLQGAKCRAGLQAPSLWAEVKETLLGSRSTKGLHLPPGTPEFWEEKKQSPPSAWPGPQASTPSPSLGEAPGKRPAPLGSRHGTAKPKNGPPGRWTEGPGDSAKVIPSSRRGGAARPRLPFPGPPRPRASAAPAPCLPPAPRPAHPGPARPAAPAPGAPQARGAPRASPRPPPAAWNPTGRHPRRARPASHPQ